MEDKITYSYFHFGPFLFKTKINNSLLSFLSKKSNDLKESYNSELAGHLENQFLFPKEVQESFYKQFLPYIEAYRSSHCEYFSLDKNIPVSISATDLWINFMNPGDFNPLHTHGSDLSFVVFLDVPEEIHEEAKMFNGKSTPPGSISFVYGQPSKTKWMKTTNNFLPNSGDVFIFPSLLQHWVAPFKSKVTRISISGNIHFTNKESWPKGHF